MRLAVTGLKGGRVDVGRVMNDPRNRPKIIRILEREAVAVEDAGSDIAETDLHRRPDDRRTPESLAHGAHYHDSWAHGPVDFQGNRAEIKVGNTHPAARMVEGGTDAHSITPVTAQRLAFPYNGGGRGRPNRKGSFAVAWSDAPTTKRKAVNHPGAAAHRILYRAVVRAVSTSRLRR